MAQLVARFVRIEEVRSSNLLSSTTSAIAQPVTLATTEILVDYRNITIYPSYCYITIAV